MITNKVTNRISGTCMANFDSAVVGAPHFPAGVLDDPTRLGFGV
jgi:hypothetical protein